MNVALPEIDGRILAARRLVQGADRPRSGTESNLVGYRPVADRVAFVAELAAAWARLAPRRCRAAGRDRARQLPEPRRPDRQWRRPRHAGTAHRGAARRCAPPAIASTGCPRRPEADGAAAGGGHRRMPRPARGSDAAGSRFESRYLSFFANCRCRAASASSTAGVRPRRPVLPSVDGGLRPFRDSPPLGNVVVGIQPARGYNIDPKCDLSRPGPGAAAFLFRALWLAAPEFRATR